MSNLVTLKQAKELASLGFAEPCIRHAYSFVENNKYILQQLSYIIRNKNTVFTLLIPTVDQAIDWIRRKFHVIVYDATEPYVCPTTMKILYAYRVKFCNVKHGWNAREYIGSTKWSKDSYAMKRQALTIAINYIKKKNARRRRKNNSRRPRVRSKKS